MRAGKAILFYRVAEHLDVFGGKGDPRLWALRSASGIEGEHLKQRRSGGGEKGGVVRWWRRIPDAPAIAGAGGR